LQLWDGILDRDRQVEVRPASNCAAQLTHPTEITSCPSQDEELSERLDFAPAL
jgi:hypothetical protein